MKEASNGKASGAYRIDSDGTHSILMQRDNGGGGEWKAQYRFTL
jgi:hypothetical protein